MTIKIKTIKEALAIIKSLQKICKEQRVLIEQLKSFQKSRKDLRQVFDKLFK